VRGAHGTESRPVRERHGVTHAASVPAR